LAFDWRTRKNVYLTLSLYRFDIQDKIIGSNEISITSYPEFINSGERDGMGAEFETRWKLTTRSSLLFNYAYAKNTVKQEGEHLEHQEISYPLRTAYLRLDWMFQPDWFINGQAYWATDYARAPDDPRQAMDDNFSVDLILRYKKVRNWDWNFALGVRNVFDEDLQEPSQNPVIVDDYPNPGRTWFVETRHKF